MTAREVPANSSTQNITCITCFESLSLRSPTVKLLGLLNAAEIGFLRDAISNAFYLRTINAILPLLSA